MRVAAVDLGTNTTRLLVADVAEGRLDEVHRESRITRLGESVDARRRLLPAPVARVRNALADYRRTLESLGAERTLAIATSAVREAENGEAFLGEIEWSYGFATRLLAGDDEALMTRRGVASGRELSPGTLVVDIGGGSTELVLDGFHASLELGAVRHTERFLAGDPPTAEELARCAGAVRAVLAERVSDETRVAATGAVGVAGTVTTLAALDLGLERYDRERVDRHRLTTAAARAQLAATGGAGARGAAGGSRARAGARAGDRRRRRDPHGDPRLLRARRDRRQRARHPRRRSARGRRAARAAGGRGAARRLHLLLC